MTNLRPSVARNCCLSIRTCSNACGTTDMAQVLNPDVIREVEQELGEHTFWRISLPTMM